jgi:hypothetical protein
MTKHDWVELQMTPIQADLIDDSIITSSSEEDERTAIENSIEICGVCHTSLTPDTIDAECPGIEGRKEV